MIRSLLPRPQLGMVGAFLLTKVTSPVMDRLPRQAQDFVLRTAGKALHDHVERHLLPAAALVFQNTNSLHPEALAELRERLDQEDWERRLLAATGDGTTDPVAWMAENPQPRYVRDYSVVDAPGH